MSPEFEIIIPTKSRPKLLDRAVRSVLAQTYPHWRIWVLDDDGPGLSWWSGNANSRINHVTGLRPPKGVVPWAWKINQIYSRLSPDAWASYCSDDAFYTPDRLEAFVEAMQQNPHALAFYGQQIVMNRGSSRMAPNQSFIWREAFPIDLKEFSGRNWIDFNSAIHKVSLVQNDPEPWVNDIGTIMASDWETWKKVARRTEMLPVKRLVAVEDWHPTQVGELTRAQAVEKFS